MDAAKSDCDELELVIVVLLVDEHGLLEGVKIKRLTWLDVETRKWQDGAIGAHHDQRMVGCHVALNEYSSLVLDSQLVVCDGRLDTLVESKIGECLLSRTIKHGSLDLWTKTIAVVTAHHLVAVGLRGSFVVVVEVVQSLVESVIVTKIISPLLRIKLHTICHFIKNENGVLWSYYKVSLVSHLVNDDWYLLVNEVLVVDESDLRNSIQVD